MLGYVHGVTVTVVGLHFANFESRHPEMAGIKDQVEAEVTRIRPEYESLCKGSTTLDVCYLSRGEYRDKVGEVQYKIETWKDRSHARLSLPPRKGVVHGKKRTTDEERSQQGVVDCVLAQPMKLYAHVDRP